MCRIQAVSLQYAVYTQQQQHKQHMREWGVYCTTPLLGTAMRRKGPFSDV
jgi:hypothetical protein